MDDEISRLLASDDPHNFYLGFNHPGVTPAHLAHLIRSSENRSTPYQPGKDFRRTFDVDDEVLYHRLADHPEVIHAYMEKRMRNGEIPPASASFFERARSLDSTHAARYFDSLQVPVFKKPGYGEDSSYFFQRGLARLLPSDHPMKSEYIEHLIRTGESLNGFDTESVENAIKKGLDSIKEPRPGIQYPYINALAVTLGRSRLPKESVEAIVRDAHQRGHKDFAYHTLYQRIKHTPDLSEEMMDLVSHENALSLELAHPGIISTSRSEKIYDHLRARAQSNSLSESTYHDPESLPSVSREYADGFAAAHMKGEAFLPSQAFARVMGAASPDIVVDALHRAVENNMAVMPFKHAIKKHAQENSLSQEHQDKILRALYSHGKGALAAQLPLQMSEAAAEEAARAGELEQFVRHAPVSAFSKHLSTAIAKDVDGLSPNTIYQTLRNRDLTDQSSAAFTDRLDPKALPENLLRVMAMRLPSVEPSKAKMVDELIARRPVFDPQTAWDRQSGWSTGGSLDPDQADRLLRAIRFKGSSYDRTVLRESLFHIATHLSPEKRSEYVKENLPILSELAIDSDRNEERPSIKGHELREWAEKQPDIFVADPDAAGSSDKVARFLEHPNVPSDTLDRLHSTLKNYHFKNFIYEHPNVSIEALRQGVANGYGHAEKALALRDPDSSHDESVHVRVHPGIGKLRKIRDFIDERHGGEASPSVLPKGEYAPFRLPNGNISAQKIQNFIDSLPTQRWNVSHSKWDGGQRHSDEDSKVFQMNLSTEHMEKMHKEGVLGSFRRMHKLSESSGHPVVPGMTIGWVRYTGEPETGIQVDEVQSDFGQSFTRRAQAEARERATKEADEKKLEGEARDDFINRFVGKATREADERWPDNDFHKISKILFNNRHPNEVISEAFVQHLRDKGHHDAEIHWHTSATKAPISLSRPDDPVPAHFKVTYEEVPKKLGAEPAKYGELPTQTNASMKGEDQWKLKVRKFEPPINDEERVVKVKLTPEEFWTDALRERK